MKKILDKLRDFVWDLLLFFNHGSVKLTGCLPNDVSGKIVVSLHRNGMMDLFLVRHLWPKVVAMTSVQWHQNFLTRWLIGGVGVTRSKDKKKTVQTGNYEAFEKCVHLLKSGMAVGIAPEGTSQLRPGHLPFQKAAARVAAKMLECQQSISVIPVSPVFLQAWGWRSPVELYVGPEMVFTAGQTMNEIHREISQALDKISLNAPDMEALMARQAAAWSLNDLRQKPGGSFSALLLENNNNVLKRISAVHKNFLLKWHIKFSFFGALVLGKRLFGMRDKLASAWIHIASLFLELLSILVRAMAYPVHALSRYLRQGLVDDLNVVALWRGLIAFPLLFLWFIILGVIAAYLDSLLWLPVPLVLGALATALEPWRLKYKTWRHIYNEVDCEHIADYSKLLMESFVEK